MKIKENNIKKAKNVNSKKIQRDAIRKKNISKKNKLKSNKKAQTTKNSLNNQAKNATSKNIFNTQAKNENYKNISNTQAKNENYKNISNSRVKNATSKNVREIELSLENIRIAQPEKVVNIKDGKRAAKSKAAQGKVHIKNTNVKNKKKNKKVKKESKPINPKVIKFLRWTSIFLLVIAVCIIICTTPIFNITTIKVTGNSKLTEKEIISLSQIKTDDNIFKYNKKEISNLIEEAPYVKKVQVKKQYPNTIELIVEERQKVASVKVLNSFAYIDNEGYVLEISEQRENLPIIEGILTDESNIKVGEKLVSDDIKKIATVLNIIKISKDEEIAEDAYTVNIENDEFILKLETQKIFVYLGDASNLKYRMNAVNEALKNLVGKQGNLYAHGDLNNGFQLYFTPLAEENIEN